MNPPAYIVMMYACFSDISIEQGGSDTSSFCINHTLLDVQNKYRK